MGNMHGWLPLRRCGAPTLRHRCWWKATRFFSAGSSPLERVDVRCGSSGSITIDLHNADKASSSDPLLIYLPPCSASQYGAPAPPLEVPPLFRRYPTAAINYRWAGFPLVQELEGPHSNHPPHEESGESQETSNDSPLHWPAPIHDTLRAYSWITEHLAPDGIARRDVYVYGSYLGASLAVSLALTECHPHQRMAIRGCAAFNGIYNWTMQLPDHPIHKKQQAGARSRNTLEDMLLSSPEHVEDPDLRELSDHADGLFNKADNLFDPFASPCLFFHTPGLLVPPNFQNPIESMQPPSVAVPSPEAEISSLAMLPLKQPRRSALAFPPRKSTLKIPEMLLLHTPPPPLPPSMIRRRRRGKKSDPLAAFGNSFALQAEELAALMRRSMEKIEFKERLKWDEDFDVSRDEEATRRVQVCDVGGGIREETIDEMAWPGNQVVDNWLEERMFRD